MVSENVWTNVDEEVFESLIESSRPDLFRVNAFRVLGLPTRATERDLKKQSEKLQMAEKFGGGVQTGGPLPLESPPDKEAIQEAMQRLRDPEQRLIDEFFWFWPSASGPGGGSDTALAALSGRDIRTAADIWTRRADADDEQGIIAHNLAVLYLAAALDLEHAAQSNQLSEQLLALRDLYWREGIAWWRRLLAHEAFWKLLEARILELNDPRLTIYLAQQLRATLPAALVSINTQLAVSATERKASGEVERQQQLIHTYGLPPEAVGEATRRGLQPLRAQIKAMCTTAEKESEADPKQADDIAHRLLTQARPMLVTVDSLLPDGHPLRDDARDEVAQSAFHCGISYSNATENWQVLQGLLEAVRPYANSVALRDKITEGLETVKRNLEQQGYRQCWFCHENDGAEISLCKVPMYGNVTRTYVGNGTHVQWEKMSVNVSRCERCWEVHKRTSKLVGRGMLLGFLAAVVILFLTFTAIGAFTEVFDAYILVGGILLLILPIVLGSNIASTLSAISSPKIVELEGKKLKHPLVLEMQGQGWKLGEGPSS